MWFKKKPDPYKEFVRLIKNPERIAGADPEVVERFLFTLLAFFSMRFDGVTEAHVHTLYSIGMSRLSEADRMDLLLRLLGGVEGGAITPLAFRPILFCELDRAVISTAAMYAAVMTPVVEGDALTGPKTVLQWIGEMNDQFAIGAALSGLLAIGDRRVVDLLDGSWRDLDRDGRESLAGYGSTGGMAFLPVVLYFLDWLEEATSEADLADAAGVLAKIAMTAHDRKVYEVWRPLPAPTVHDARPPIQILREWSLREVGKQIEPRLRRVLARETPPTIVDQVMVLWGIRV